MTVVGAATGKAGERMRRITLEPLARHPVTMEFIEVESTIPCGFRTNWLSGEAEPGDTFDLDSGAGFGSTWLTFRRHGRYLALDMRKVVDALFHLTEDPVEWVKCPECHGPLHADWCENTDLVLPSQVANP